MNGSVSRPTTAMAAMTAVPAAYAPQNARAARARPATLRPADQPARISTRIMPPESPPRAQLTISTGTGNRRRSSVSTAATTANPAARTVPSSSVFSRKAVRIVTASTSTSSAPMPRPGSRSWFRPGRCEGGDASQVQPARSPARVFEDESFTAAP
nr:hypothetical protein [Streptomyces clavuligerus]